MPAVSTLSTPARCAASPDLATSGSSIASVPLDRIQHGRGLTLANALAAMQVDTRHFARRQRTWFRGVREAIWLDPDDRSAIDERVAAFVAESAPLVSRPTT